MSFANESYRFSQGFGTKANLESGNPVLNNAEFVLDTTDKRGKFGNGTDGWNDLPFIDEDTTLKQSYSSGVSSITVFKQSVDVNDNSFVIIDPFTTSCEIVRVSSVSGNAITLSANTQKAHSKRARVIFTTQPRWDIRLFGAKTTETATNNRTAILASITNRSVNGGGNVYIPKGRYVVNKAPGIACFILTNQTNIFLIGDGIDVSILELEAGSYAGDTHLFSMTGCSNIMFRDITFDGNRTEHSVSNEQMHAVRTFDCQEIRFQNCKFFEMRGDGIFLLGNTLNHKIWVDTCSFYSCGRSGVTIQRLNKFLTINNCYFDEINDQAIDSEPTGGVGYDNTNITNNFFYWSTPRNIGVTLGGSDSQGVNFINNQLINAGLFSTSLSNSKIHQNIIQGPVALLETADNVSIFDNDITSTGKCINIYYQNAQPQNFRIKDNRCYTSSTTENIIEVQIDGVVIDGNTCYATDSAGTTGTGILVSAPTVSGSGYKELAVSNNKVFNCNTGVTVSASSSKKWASGHILNNTLKDLRSSKTMVYGINLSGPAFYHFDELYIDKNVFDSSLTQANQIVLNASGCSYYKVTSNEIAGIVAPEGVVTATYNTLYNYIGYPYRYTKTTDTGNTGWVEKNLALENVIVEDTLYSSPQASISSHTPAPTNYLSGSWTNQVGQHDTLGASEATATTLSSGRAICTYSSGISDLIIQSSIRTGVAGNEYSGIVFRYTDSDNFWSFEISAGLDTARVVKREGGSDTVMASVSITVPSSGKQVLQVRLKVNIISCTYNGGSLITLYSSFGVSATAHGFISRVASRYYFEDFKISG